MSLRVNFGPVEVDFWSVIGGFRLRSSNFEPLGIDFRCLEVKLGILVVLIRLLRVKFEPLRLNSRPLEVEFRRKSSFLASVTQSWTLGGIGRGIYLKF